MKGTIYQLVFGIFILIISCGKPTEKAENIEVDEKEVPQEQRELMALYDEVIAIHDEVMPKMDNLMQARGAIQEKLDTLRDSNPNNVTIPVLEQSLISLSAADEAMMDWMRNFTPQDDVEDHQAAIDYYKEEKEKISEVKTKMLEALEEAARLRKKED